MNRFLTYYSHSEPRIDPIVTRSCLSFRLTERDREGFRDLSASPSILAALTDCSEDASLTVTASPDSLRATVGDTVSVLPVVARGDTVAAAEVVADAVTDGGGGAVAVLGIPGRSLEW